MEEPSKRCCTCGAVRPLTHYNVRRAAPDGRQARCRDCNRQWYLDHRDDHRNNVRKNKDAVRKDVRSRLAAWFAEHPCVDCGERDVRCLEFDHLDAATKLTEIGNMLREVATWRRVLAEIEKCDVRCANCHRRVTAERGRWWRQAVYEQVRGEREAETHARLERVFAPR